MGLYTTLSLKEKTSSELISKDYKQFKRNQLLDN